MRTDVLIVFRRLAELCEDFQKVDCLSGSGGCRTQPCQNLLSFAIDLIHSSDLNCLFLEVYLIDAYATYVSDEIRNIGVE